MDSVLGFITNYKVVDIIIALMGFGGTLLILERFKALYFDYNLDSVAFMNVVMGLVRENKFEEAITFCSSNSKKPLAHVMKRILERADCDERDITHAFDTATSEIAPQMMKRLGYLAMISNVVTLIGLLGTVIGLIMSFKAVSFADPSQKQTLLADGISIAMHATAMGLLVAIPVLVLYSFLHDKQGKIFADVDRCANQIIEHLNLRGYVKFNEKNAFPDDLATALNPNAKTPPPPASVKTAPTRKAAG